MFQQARQNRVFQDVVSQIEEAIVDGKLEAGSKLPSEREMISIFKTSRGTLREALRVLEQKGLISIKTGVKGGSVVNALTTDKVSESLDLLIRFQKVSLRDLAEFREGVEGIIAGLAAERAHPEDIRHLKDLLETAKEHVDEGESGWDDFIRVDNKIHMLLAKIAGNPVYESVLETIYQNIHRYFDQYLSREPHIIKENYLDLCEIVGAVESRQAAKAHLLVQNHVYRFNRLMEQKAGSDGKISL